MNRAAALILCMKRPRLIDPAGHTNIGNMTGSGGLAAVFDGQTSETAANSASGGSAVTRYVGKTWATPQYVTGARYFGSSDQGISNGSNTVEVQIWGKTGAAPSSDTDGTFVGNANGPASVGGGPVADSNGLTMEWQFLTPGTWDHTWARVISTGETATKYCAELEFYTS